MFVTKCVSVSPIVMIINLGLVFTQKNCSQYGISVVSNGYCPLLEGHNQQYFRPVIFTNAYKQISSDITTIALQFDAICFTKVLNVTQNNYPIISEELDEQNRALLKYPKCFTEPNQISKDLQVYEEFQFDNRYGTYWKNEHLIGFNTDWLGCPQDMCLNGNIDAIYKIGRHLSQTINSKILRGRHVFEMDSNYKLKPIEPKLIGPSLDLNLLNDSVNWPRAYIDAMVHIKYGKEDTNYLIKGDEFWYSMNVNINDTKSLVYKPFSNAFKLKDRFGPNFPSNIDSMIALEPYVYVFKDAQYWRGLLCKECALISDKFVPLSNFSGPRPVSDIHKSFPKKVDEIILNNSNYIHIFSEWNFYDLGFVQTNKGLEEELKTKLNIRSESLFDKFGCTDDSYRRKGFNGLNDYLNKIHTFYKLETSDQLETRKTYIPFTLQTYYYIFGVIVVAMIGITIIVYFVLRHKKIQTIERQKQMDIIEAKIMPNKDNTEKPLTTAEKNDLAKRLNKVNSNQKIINK